MLSNGTISIVLNNDGDNLCWLQYNFRIKTRENNKKV